MMRRNSTYTWLWLLPVWMLVLSFVGRTHVSESNLDSIESPRADSSTVFRLFLIGDAGGRDNAERLPVLSLLASMTSSTRVPAASVFLGDNLYCCGMPAAMAIARSQAEIRLSAQLNSVRQFEGRSYFIPGNHDWGNSSPGDPERLAREFRFLETNGGSRVTFIPKDLDAGPASVALTDSLTLLALDTEQWIEHAGNPSRTTLPGVRLKSMLASLGNRTVVIAGHHPIRSLGKHGGYFPIKDHIFPLTALWKGAYLPLPIIGSLYPILRNRYAGRQDLNHPKYRAFIAEFLSAVEGYHGRILYVSGHEHNLQILPNGSLTQIVSGSGSKTEYVAPGKGLQRTAEREGIITVDFDSAGHYRIIAWGINARSGQSEMLFSHASTTATR